MRCFARMESPGLIKLVKGGMISWYRHRLVLTRDASPEAAPACPMFGFTDPMAHGVFAAGKKLVKGF